MAKTIEYEPFVVVRDTREQKGWDFKADKICGGTISQKLDTGDYSLVGYTDIFVIERKLSTSEIANNLKEKRWEAELIRLSKFKYPFIICEFSWDDVVNFPINSGVPPNIYHKVKMSGEFIRSSLMRYELQYKIPIIYAGHNGDIAAMELFKHLVRLRANGKI